MSDKCECGHDHITTFGKLRECSILGCPCTTYRPKAEPDTLEDAARALIVDAEFNCPACDHPHVDADEWINTPHRTHLCLKCGIEFDVTVRGTLRTDNRDAIIGKLTNAARQQRREAVAEFVRRLNKEFPGSETLPEVMIAVQREMEDER